MVPIVMLTVEAAVASLFPSTEPTTLLTTQWTYSGTALLYYIFHRGLVDRLLVALVFWHHMLLLRLLFWLLLLLQQQLWHLL